MASETAGQDQSDIFTGVSGPADLTESASVKGTPATRLPAFVLGEELADLADRDSRIAVMTADLASANRTIEFQQRHPERYFDFGIAEKNMITAAAGMASCGQIPYAATFASFCAILGAEQIRTDCAYPKMPVRVVGTHSGISMGFYGTSHHATEDLGMMRTIADLTVVCTTDANHLRAVLRASVDHPGAMYIRLGRGRDPEVYSEVPSGFAIGKAIRLRDGQDLTIIATGSEVRPALDAAEILAMDGILTRVVDMHTIKPLDIDEISAAARETMAILTVEEHSVIGGLGSAVAEVLVGLERLPFERHGIHDEFAPVGPPDSLYAHFKLDAQGIETTARALLQRVTRALLQRVS